MSDAQPEPVPAPEPSADWATAIGRARPILVTGAAGFIGFHLAGRLLDAGLEVIGLDNVNAYYDVQLKEGRLALLTGRPGFRFARIDLADGAALGALMAEVQPAHVVHLAAQAGVRFSLEQPLAYAHSNLTGFLNLLEACRHAGVRHLVYASSSSVYGGNAKVPYAEADGADHPVSLYAATKRANELMAHAYSHLYAIPATGLRFFTVYGPWGRPDMAYWKFTEALFAGRTIEVYNHGRMARDFTYVDDVVEGLARLIPLPPAPDPGFDRTLPGPGRSWAPHRVLNLGNTRRESLETLIATLERLTGRRAVRQDRGMQPGDVVETWADMAAMQRLTGWRPATPLEEGLTRFVAWYRARFAV